MDKILGCISYVGVTDRQNRHWLLKNCSWRLKTPKEQILAIKKFVINKIVDHEFRIVFGHFTLYHYKLTVYKPYSHAPQSVFIFDIQLAHVFAAHLTRLSSCIINGYGCDQYL